ncbi:MAG: multidrug ABC transporter ATP-binding protein [Blastopirellula sp.]|nr:MAG: multidrug ABC transporter ATP-binding protein [Blastopirellula sp.]
MLATNNLTKRYGNFTALDNVSITIEQGQCCGVLGPNGAGKSTMFRLLMGFLRPTSGTAQIAGHDCQKQQNLVHQQVTYLPGDVRLPGAMRGRNVLQFFAEVHPHGNYQRALDTAKRLDLDLSRRVAFMSTGMRQKLGLCIVLSNESPVAIMDEPTTSLDPNVRLEVIHLIKEANDAGKTVVICSHVLSEIEDICSRAIIMRSGQVVHDQDLANLRNQHIIQCRLPDAMPEIPSDLSSLMTNFEHKGERIQFSTNGDLSPILPWLTGLNASEVQIRQIGLKAIYQQHHDTTAEEVSP